MTLGRSIVIGLLGIGVAAAALDPVVDRATARRDLARRLDRLANEAAGTRSCRAEALIAVRVERLGPWLASWQMIGGCGAGASASAGGGLKWIGRGATGGMIQVECQGSYTVLDDGTWSQVNSQLRADVGEKWTVGASVPLLFKHQRNVYNLGRDASIKGLGDVNALVTRKLGAINDYSLTLSLGLPTGVHDAARVGAVLPQQTQLGAGRMSGSVVAEHTMDNRWGPVVLGGTVAYRGGENELRSYRAPSGSLYSYMGYVTGPFVPSFGLSLNGQLGGDRDRGMERPDQALYTVAASPAIEWSTDWIALLVGASLPFSTAGLEPWTVGLGATISVF